MTPLRAAFRFRRLAVLLCLPACHTWTPVALAPAPALGKSASVRVERAGQKRAVYFARARVVGDSLLGRGDDASRLPIAVALADVRRAEQRHFSVKRTTGLVIAAGVVAGIIAAALADNSGYGLQPCAPGQRSVIC
jgi:hypothetical protein